MAEQFVCVLGFSKSGRTAMCRRWSRNEYQDNHPQEDLSTSLAVRGTVPETRVILQDMLGYSGFGQDSDLLTFMPSRYSSFLPRSKSGPVVFGFVVMYDITRREAFESAKYWLDLISRVDAFHATLHKGIGPLDLPIAVLILGNKTDSADQRQVTTVEGEELAVAYSKKHSNLMCRFAEVSAKTNEGVFEAFDVLVDLCQITCDDGGRCKACRAAVMCVLMAGRRPESGLSRDVARVIAMHLLDISADKCWIAAAKKMAKGKKAGCCVQ